MIYLTQILVKTVDETLDKIINDKCSVSRFGDGEFAMLMLLHNLRFQVLDKRLSIALDSVINSRLENHIVCLPPVFESVDYLSDLPRNFWGWWVNWYGHLLTHYIDMNKEYYNSFISRLYFAPKDKSKVKESFDKAKLIWNNRDILIVEGEQSRLGVGNDLFDNSKSIQRILCPAINAFSKYDEIFNEIKKQDTSKLILIALGPTATVLAYDLCAEGYQSIDIGHIDIEYEWFLQGVTEVCPVKNKYVDESIDGRIVGEIHDIKYESEIIAKII